MLKSSRRAKKGGLPIAAAKPTARRGKIGRASDLLVVAGTWGDRGDPVTFARELRKRFFTRGRMTRRG